MNRGNGFEFCRSPKEIKKERHKASLFYLVRMTELDLHACALEPKGDVTLVKIFIEQGLQLSAGNVTIDSDILKSIHILNEQH